MKKYFSVVLVLILAFTVLGCSKMNDEEAIKSTITKFYQGWEDEDIAAIGSCLDDEYSDADVDSKSQLLMVLEVMFAFAEISDVKLVFSNIVIAGDLATVDVRVTMTQEIMEEKITDTINVKISMVKRGSEWLIKSQG